MQKKLIKIRVVGYFNSDLFYDIISYEDEVPENGKAYKGTRRHKEEDIVTIGVPWTQVSETVQDDGPMWSAYVILDGNTKKAECSLKTRELFEIVKALMIANMNKFLNECSSFEFNADKFSKKFDEYFANDGDC